jgi:hypothetical protein
MAERTMSEERKKMSMLKTATAMILAIAALGAFATSASAGQAITEFEVGSSTSQAGGHPDLTARLKLANPGEPEVARNVEVNLPEGVFGNPGAIFRCRAAVFIVNECQSGAQVGTIAVIANYEGNPNFTLGTAPIYNLETISEDESARFAFVAPTINVPVVIPVNVRSDSDYGLQLSINSIAQTLALNTALLNIWGFPADPDHDSQRFFPGGPGNPPGCPGENVVACLAAPYPQAGVIVKPFTVNPSICTSEDLPVSIKVTTYQDPNPTEGSSSYPATTECESQKFDPVFNLGLTTKESDAPSGLDIQLIADQFLTGTAPSPSTLRSAELTLPEGLTVNPDAADGQTKCLDAEAGFGTNAPGQCPDNSKIGTVEVRTPALDEPLDGSLYIGEPKPGNQYRVFMIFDGQGIHAKLVAAVLPDPVTGQVTMALDNIPQVPFEEFNLHLFASDRGLMATPTQCTIYKAESVLTPWNPTLAPQSSSPLVSITSGPNGRPCPGQTRPFNPRLVAGTSSPSAGDFSSFTLKLDRDDGDQFLGDLNFRMPPGFTGNLSGISYCPDAAIAAATANSGLSERAAPSCPVQSQVGTTNVAAGPGGHPFHAVGKMYLAGPFKGGPLSVVAVTPALAGPYDYGVVVVRVALQVDPQTAQVFAASDTVPSIIGGIPIRMRSIQVNIDKPNFTINPTNCSPYTVDSQGIGDQGTVSDFSSYFQVVNCSRLAFKPKMKVKVIGKKIKRGQNPKLKFDLRTRSGDANIKTLSVTLPKAFEIDQAHLGNICSEKELVEKECAGRTAIGKASTQTPLLDEPLAGPVYAVSGGGGLPRLAFLLNGQVKILPRAETKSVKARLKTTVPVVPDAPIGHFSLTVFGGKTGYLDNTRNLCKNPPKVTVEYTAQNGKKRSENVNAKPKCGKKKKK